MFVRILIFLYKKSTWTIALWKIKFSENKLFKNKQKKTTIFKGITAEQLRETEEEDEFVENKVIAAVMEVRLGLQRLCLMIKSHKIFLKLFISF